MPSAGVRFAGEAAFLVLVALGLGLARFSPIVIGVVMFVAWVLVALLERASAQEAARAAEPASEEAVPIPPPHVERVEVEPAREHAAEAPEVLPEPTEEPEREPAVDERTARAILASAPPPLPPEPPTPQPEQKPAPRRVFERRAAPPPPPPPPASTVDVNSGGSAFTASDGSAFSADQYFSSGSTYSTSHAISGTTDDALYQNERWGTFSYSIPVVNGTYDVRFYFAEIYWGGVSSNCAGKRVFSMDILDTPTKPDIANLDICAQVVPWAALVKTVTGVQVSDGRLDIQAIKGSADNPEVTAIAVLPSSAPVSGGGDTQPPTTPTNFVQTGATTSSVSVSWTASTDNVGVAGYGLYRDGVFSASTTATSYTFTGLACGTTYNLAVDAYDAAGNRSSQASASGATSACPTSSASGVANLWVDPSGGSCTRQSTPAAYVDGQACSSLNAAYAAANAGDLILIKGGSYGAQTIADRSLATGNPVVFHPAPGESVTINGDLIVNTHDLTIDGGDTLNQDEPNRITVAGAIQALEQSGQGDTRNVVFEDIHAASTFNTAHGLTIRYSEIGPNAECTSGAADLSDFWPNAGTPRNIFLLYNLIHTDNQNSCLNNGDHTDALQIYPAGGTVDNVVIRGNRFWWCGEQCIFLGDGNYTHTVIENNMVEETDACGNCGPAMEVNFFSDNNASTGDVFQYNTVEGVAQLPNNVPARGNVFLTPQSCTGAVYSFDVFPASGGSTCGTSPKRCTPLLASGSFYSGDRNADWHISSSDTCARDAGDPTSFPPTDIDQQIRPMGKAPDAGADEAG